MTKEEFIEWINITEYSDDGYGNYKSEVDYTNCIYDYVYINSNTVEFCWDELYWGGSTYHSDEYSFEEFIEKYNNDSLKY